MTYPYATDDESSHCYDGPNFLRGPGGHAPHLVLPLCFAGAALRKAAVPVPAGKISNGAQSKVEF